MESYITVCIFCSQYVLRDNYLTLSNIRSPKTLDVQPGNILFSLPNIHSLNLTFKPISHNLKQSLTQLSVLMGKLTFGHHATLSSLATVEAGFMIRISDMGAGQYFRKNPDAVAANY